MTRVFRRSWTTPALRCTSIRGCYKGQETVARVHNLGRPPRRLVFLDIDGSEHTLPAVGSELFVEGKARPVGRITSVALHHEAGPIALGRH